MTYRSRIATLFAAALAIAGTFTPALLAATVLPHAASAHEVYVLSSAEIATAMSMPSPNPFSIVPASELQFLGWGAAVAIALLIVLSISISRLFERVFDPFLARLKKYAPLIGRVTLGVSFIASGYFGDFFGPELPDAAGTLHAWGMLLSWAMVAIGVLIILGFMTRIAALAGLLIFGLTMFEYRWYMLTYVNYLGEIVLFLILGGERWSLDSAIPALRRLERPFARMKRRLEPYAFLILRVLFGLGVFFASFYAKFLHSNLALDTVADYHLTQYFPFTPLFLVLGAFIIEALIGICLAIGFEVRFMALVFTFFLTLSIMFFGEAVWPHIILFGVNIALFCHGYDKYTVEMALFQRKRRGEPVL